MRIELREKFSQNDPRWRGVTLGTSGTIGAFGCLETIATMVANYFGANENPITLNDRLKNNNGYANGNLFVWGVFARLFGLKYAGQFSNPGPLTLEQMNQIRNQLDKGFPVFLQIDTVPSTSQLDEHWILAIDYDGDDFIVQDPWDGATKRITSWGVLPQKLIYAWAWFEGAPANVIANDPVISIKASDRDRLVGRSTVAKEVGSYLGLTNPDQAPTKDYTNTIGGFKSRATDLEKKLAESNAEVENREEQTDRLKEQVESSETLRKELTDKLNIALSGSGSVVATYEAQLKAKQEQITEISKEKGALNVKVAQLESQVKKLQDQGTAGLSVYDTLQLLLAKLIPVLKSTPLK